MAGVVLFHLIERRLNPKINEAIDTWLAQLKKG